LFGNKVGQHRSKVFARVGCIIEKADFYTYLGQGMRICCWGGGAFGLPLKKLNFESLYKKVQLWGRQHDKVKTYSQGMKQRLGLAQVLLHNPDLIILDEPNTGLDPQGIIDLRNLILSLNREEGKTVLFSSHVLNEVQEICTDILIIHRGKK
jgi:ABC-type multidrug transport system, ATPase component